MAELGKSYGSKWSHDETVLALALYFQIPFGKIAASNPKIEEIARLINRTPSSLSMKMCNIGRLDPTLQKRGVSGLVNGAKLEQMVWDEFYGHSEKLAAEFSKILSAYNGGAATSSSITVDMNFFRKSVLAAYNNTCCITGIDDERLLSAYHFKPVVKCADDSEIMNPENGVCFSGLYGDAFEKGLITIDETLKVVLSKSLKDHLTAVVYDDFFKKYDNTMIRTPARSRPGKDFIQYHNEHIFVA